MRLSAIGYRLSAIDHLPALEEAGFLERQGGAAGGGYSFRHGLIRESAYAALLHAQRRELHGVAASALERLYPTRLADLAGTLALHHEGAGQLLLAARSYGQAADGARLLYANEEADAGYQKALALLEAAAAPDDDLRARTHLKLAQVRMNAGDYTAAQELYDVAFELLERVEAQRPAQQRRKRKAQVFRMGADEPETLDPALVETTSADFIVGNLFEGLVELDADLNVVPAVARRWQIEESGRRYRFELRQGLRWSDGEPLTAHDFVYAWRRNLSPHTDAGAAHQLYLIRGARAWHQGEVSDPATVGVSAPDSSTLIVDLISPAVYFLYLLAEPITFPQPAHRPTEPAQTHIIGNGPYRLAEWAPGRSIELERNTHYVERHQPAIEHAVIHLRQGTHAEYQRGQIDYLQSDGEVLQPENAASVTVTHYPMTFFLAFALQAAPFRQLPLRRAFAACIDQTELVAEAKNGAQLPANGGVVPLGMPGHSPALGTTFDPDLARRLWAEHGGQHTGPLTLATIPGAQAPRYLVQQWQERLGVTVALRENTPVEEMVALLAKGEIQLACMAWECEYPDPDAMLRVVFHSQSPYNCFGWHHSQFDSLVERAASETDQTTRLRLYHEADHLLVREHVAVVPLFYYRTFGLLRQPFQLRSPSRVMRGYTLHLKDLVLAPTGTGKQPTSAATAAPPARRKQ